MSDKIVVENVHPSYDGEYDFDTSQQFTYRELHTIKRLSGLRQGEFADALAALDADFALALGVVVLQRHGKDVVEEALWDAAGGSIRLVAGEVADADPPTVSAPGANGNGSATSSGSSTSDGSAHPANDPSRTGTPSWDRPTSEYETSLS